DLEKSRRGQKSLCSSPMGGGKWPIFASFRGIVWAAKRHLFCEVILKCWLFYSPESDLEKCRRGQKSLCSSPMGGGKWPIFAIFRDIPSGSPSNLEGWWRAAKRHLLCEVILKF